MTKIARGAVVATEVQRDKDGYLASPRKRLISRMSSGVVGLVRPRSPGGEDIIHTAQPPHGTDRDPEAARSMMDAGITGGLSLLFGSPDETSP